MEQRIPVLRRDLIETLRFLEVLVVMSLDRVGSATAEAPRGVQAEHLLQYIDEWDVFRKAATVRRSLGECFSDGLAADGKDELERELENTRHRTSSAPTPGPQSERWWRPLAD